MLHHGAELALRLVIVGLAWVAFDVEPGSPVSPPPHTRTATGAMHPASACPEGMLLVDGDYCDAVEEPCENDRPKPHLGCLRYASPTTCVGQVTHLRFCIDDYEFPDHAGEKPQIMASWYDAERMCHAAGKRVCGSRQWTLACEGPERLPYPYGYERDASACHIDELGPMINEKRFYSVDKDKEIERIDRREPSGARPGCVSPYGVHDLTGNVDEWTTNETGIPDHGALKGGNWGEWRNACRPVTLGHAAWFRYYQLGFRCCTDADP